ncbi:c-type cytochrome [Horticoccus sp. 23ND18S-11]|uniref:c-type cytochrome n=1 Tax=Horticoccus sp. 23ND18S-11 TaxID=3391832 RepID=UPI0039C9E2A9
MRHVYLITLFVCVLAVSVLGFRGTTFTAPPMDVFPEWAFPGMKHQPKFRPQSESVFFADGRSDRVPPAHTVARGMLREDDHLYRGKDAAGAFVAGIPAALTVDGKFLERGRDRYQIYCAPCHSATGDGNGITKRYGMGATPSYHDPRLRTMAEGEIYNTITNGKNTMMPYADKLVPEDRWAVVAYVRALQRAQLGKATDVADAAAKTSLGIQ